MSDIVILGSGNVASHFIKALSTCDIRIRQIYSRNSQTAANLCKVAKCEYVTKIDEIFPDADFYFFIMNDEANAHIAKQISINSSSIAVHTAGSQSMHIFGSLTNNFGVFYPFQTFTKGVETDFSKVPICIEASNPETYLILDRLAQKLGCKTFNIDEAKREVLHLSGVFASNFMNHCVNIAEDILLDNNIDTNIIKPLLEQSHYKIINHGAEASQTGPALRNDNHTIEKHLKLIEKNAQYSAIYRVLTDSIKTKFNKLKK
jgi:predicted short-subunit dehydrogenase-like oxidoreductase (DUF2520 family)